MLNIERLVKISVLILSAFIWQSFAPLSTVHTERVTMQDVTVYICVTGEVYHSNRNCRGLKNARHEIKAVPLSKVVKHRRPCKICY